MAQNTADHLHHQEAQLDTTKASLERIKKQLTTSARFLLQGPLLKRSETLRKWNQRWVTLDPTTAKMEYRIERGDILPKGLIHIDAGSNILVSPINIQGLPKYDGCCIYIQNLNKKEYFLCAETPAAARAWVSTLQASQLVLKAHKEAISSLGSSEPSKIGLVATVVAAANATAKEAAKEIAVTMSASNFISLRSKNSKDGLMDNLSIMKETLRVKDDELHQLSKDIRARDATIKDLASRLSETAAAAEAAASAAHIMDKERKNIQMEIRELRKELDAKLESHTRRLQSLMDKLSVTEKELDGAALEANTWQIELAKAKEQALVMDAALKRTEENARQIAADAESRIKAAMDREATALAAKHAAEAELESLRACLTCASYAMNGLANQLDEPQQESEPDIQGSCGELQTTATSTVRQASEHLATDTEVEHTNDMPMESSNVTLVDSSFKDEATQDFT